MILNEGNDPSFKIIWHSEPKKKLDQYSQLLQTMITGFNNRFEDFHKMNEMEFPIFNNPFNFEASQTAVHLQMELIDLQSDSILE